MYVIINVKTNYIRWRSNIIILFYFMTFMTQKSHIILHLKTEQDVTSEDR